MTGEGALSALDDAIRRAATEELPALALALTARLAAVAASMADKATVPPADRERRQAEERLLTAEEAVVLVGGDATVKWLYRHTRGLRFRRDLSRKCVRFEEAGLRRWLGARR